MRWTAITVAALLPLAAHAAPPPYPYPADPLLTGDRQTHPPQLLWHTTDGEHLDGGRLRLAAGESTSLALPAQGHLRLQADRDEQPPRLWLSADGRLWRQAPWQPGTTRGEWFHVLDDPQPLFARLRADTPLDGRLLVAGYQRIDLPRRFVGVPGLDRQLESLRLHDGNGALQNAYGLPAGRSVAVEIEGPALLALGGRPLASPAGETAPEAYGLQWAMDDSPWQFLTIDRPSAGWLERIDSCQLYGDEARRYLAVPAGRHRLRLHAPQALLLTLERADTQAYRLSKPGQPLASRLEHLLATPDTRLPRLEALRQSNHLQDAAATALASLQPRAGTEPLPTEVALRRQIERRQRFYRNLLPAAVSRPLTLQAAWFAPTPAPQQSEEPRLILPDDGDIGGLSRGLFLGIGTQPLDYPLPARSAPSRLRIAVAMPRAEQQATLWVQYDRQPAQPLQLQDLLEGSEQVSSQDAQLSSLGDTRPSLGAAFASHQPSGHYWRTATVELPLPAQTVQVRLWSERPLEVAVQYRAAQPYYLDEHAYRALLTQLPASTLVASLHRALREVDRVPSGPLPPEIPPAQALANQWYPLLRYLQASQAAYLDDFSIQPPAKPSDEPGPRLVRARKAAGDADWPAVLEALGTLGYGHDLGAYELSQSALAALAEPHLASRQRQAAALFGSDSATRARAQADLLAEYARTQAWDNQIRLLAALFLQRGEAKLLEPLGEALLHADEPRWAAQIGVLLALGGNSPDWLAEAAWQAGWLGSADSAIGQLPPQRQALLRGDFAARKGHLEQALAHWRNAGEPGTERRSRLEQAQAIAGDLASPSQDVRHAAIARWIAWTRAQGQRFRWTPATDQIDRAAGFTTLFSELTQLPFTLPRATAGTPVELEVVGPTVLRVQARRLHPPSGRAREDWLLAEVAGQTLRYPLSDRPDNPYVTALAEDASVSVGEEILLQVPAGLQRIRLHPRGEQTLLLQIAQWQAAEPWAVLPPPTPLALRAHLSDRPAGQSRADAGPTYRLVERCSLRDLPLLPPEQLYTHGLEDTPESGAALRSLHLPPFASPQPDWPSGSQAVALGNGPPAAAAPPDSAEDAFRQAVTLLWQRETGAPNAGHSAPRIAQLAQVYQQVEALQQLQQRATAGYRWEQALTASESAGVRPLPQHAQLQSPFRRVRQALLPATPPDALWLQGRDVQGISLSSPEPSRLALQLNQPGLPFTRVVPAQVMVQVDERPPRHVALDGGSAQLHLSLEPGDHAIRLWLQDPRQQQLVIARVEQAGQPLPQLEEDERIYHIAAAGQPARFDVKGPAWVRIDEWRPGGAPARYQYLAPGWQTVTLPAGTGGEDRYYRLYTLREAERPEPLERPLVHAAIPAPASAPPAAEPPEPVAWSPQDAFAPGKALSSLGGYLEFVDRIEGSEEDPNPVQGSNYAEAGLRYRMRLPDRLLFSRSDLLVRKLDVGQTVLGARQWLDYYPAQSPWELNFLGEAHLQPGQVPGLEASSPWSVHVQGQVRREFPLTERLEHEVQLALDMRWLSEDKVPDAAIEELDPDVYTRYRDDHRRALTLADRLSWYPRLDQRVYAEAGLVSNEDLNLLDPDHLRVTLAAGQLFGPVSAEAGLRWRHYFADDDRSSSLERKRAFVRLNGLRWGRDSNAIQVRVEASYDMDQRAFGWQLTLSFDDNDGGLSPALRPDELDFLPVRRALQRDRVDSNLLRPVYP